MLYYKSFKELKAIAHKELFPALVGDVLDKMGYLHQFLPASIKPIDSKLVVFGKAMPVLEADFFGEQLEKSSNSYINKPFGIMFEALDSLKEDEVYICTGASLRYALWGGLMSTRAMKLKASGAILHGYSRDTNEVLRLGFPVFSMGTYAQDQGPRGKVVDYRVPIEIGKVRINPGDILYGDLDGVVVVPKEIQDEVFIKALEKARGEKTVLKALQNGMSTVDAFEKYGIM
ncbi:dimethylmenaquinone methyltransferase [Seonamhaeicola sp. S2-3]|uniref:RraA family protein n=1 Tax=Seonamhaeicola sp. S2-3 TaxID=1936081 RepID=UPI00097269C7|nr:RraA family protein [Seonamhaeicola sp. S2-3]APY11618.1 dimethylmenaquinone methyltransferase [Seonamhaeicola sp. S2-3]